VVTKRDLAGRAEAPDAYQPAPGCAIYVVRILGVPRRLGASGSSSV